MKCYSLLNTQIQALLAQSLCSFYTFFPSKYTFNNIFVTHK